MVRRLCTKDESSLRCIHFHWWFIPRVSIVEKGGYHAGVQVSLSAGFYMYRVVCSLTPGSMAEHALIIHKYVPTKRALVFFEIGGLQNLLPVDMQKRFI